MLHLLKLKYLVLITIQFHLFPGFLAPALLNWKFPSTAFDNTWAGDIAHIDDACDYDLWKNYSETVIEKMKKYNEVKKNFKAVFKKDFAAGLVKPGLNEYTYVHAVATMVHEARLLQANMIKANITYDPDLLVKICEGEQDLFYCRQHEPTSSKGVCVCFDLDEAAPMYTMKNDKSECEGDWNTTCNPDDPIISDNKCNKKYQCQSLSVEACQFAYGPDFHCTGDSASGKDVGNQNMFCVTEGHQPEYANDLNQGSSVVMGFNGGFYQLIHYSFKSIALHHITKILLS